MTTAAELQVSHVLPPVAENIFAFADDGQPYLIGGFCPACGRYYFPFPEYCGHCQGSVEIADLGRQGVIYSHTVIRTKPPYGLPKPYAVAMIDLDAVPLRIFCLLDPGQPEGYRIEQTVRLAVAPIGHDGAGRECLRPYFTTLQD